LATAGKWRSNAFGQIELRRKSRRHFAEHDVRHCVATKVVATTTLVAKLAEGDFAVPLDLDAKIERYLPNGRAAEHRVAASSDGAAFTDTHFGLPPFKEYWRTSKAAGYADEIFGAAGVTNGTKEVYSDLGIF